MSRDQSIFHLPEVKTLWTMLLKKNASSCVISYLPNFTTTHLSVSPVSSWCIQKVRVWGAKHNDSTDILIQVWLWLFQDNDLEKKRKSNNVKMIHYVPTTMSLKCVTLHTHTDTHIHTTKFEYIFSSPRH